LNINESKINIGLNYMNKYAIAIGICLSLISNVTKGQQMPQFSHNMFNNMGINPGFAGLNDAITATLIARQQWLGLSDAEGTSIHPETYSATVSSPVPFLRGGVGIGFLQDQLGFETNLGVKMVYSHHVELDYGVLGLGLGINFIDKSIDFAAMRPITENDPVLAGAAKESAMMVDFDLGVFYKQEDVFWGGVSVAQIAQTNKQIGNSAHQLRREVSVSAGYNHIMASNPAFVVSPSILLKTDLSAIQADLNTIVTFNDRFWGGASYRLQDAIVIFLGLNFEQFSIGYSYDITLSPLGRRGRSFGSHEILVQYSFDLSLERVNVKHRNVRFL